MKLRKLHTIIGIALLIPFFAWAVTGMIFFIKPGYAGAYDFLQIKKYPLDGSISVKNDSTWKEVRYFKTVLGNHLMASTSEGMLHLDPITLQPKSNPTKDEIRLLLADAFKANPERYGEVLSISGDTIMTTTNIQVIFDWSSMSLQQRGPDTDRIDWFYKVHYLQWTGVKVIDRILGPLGLALVCTLSVLGISLAIGSRRKKTM